ncbi:hypothetical protein ACOMHN_060206 [Nucella lapillus]
MLSVVCTREGLNDDKGTIVNNNSHCRSMSMAYEEPSEVLGIPTMKFVVKYDEFANATVNPWNAGFCLPYNHCIPSGVLNCSAMGHGAPLYVSLPHFLGGDPFYFRQVEGLHPSKELHQPYFHLHPLTGVCLSAGRRYQLNLLMQQFPFLSKTHGVPKAYVPILWLDGIAKIDNSIGDMFKHQIEIPMAAAKYFHYSLFGIAPLMVLIPVIVLLQARRQDKKKTLLKKQAENGTAQATVQVQNGHGSVNGSLQSPDERSVNSSPLPDERTPLI